MTQIEIIPLIISSVSLMVIFAITFYKWMSGTSLRMKDLQKNVESLQSKEEWREKRELYTEVSDLVGEIYPKHKLIKDYEGWSFQSLYKITRKDKPVFKGCLEDVKNHCLAVRTYSDYKKQVKR